MATDWLGRLGKRGFESLVDDVVRHSLERVIQERVEPRFVSVENRLGSVENRLAGIETRLDVADRLAKLEVEVAALRLKV